MGVSWIRAAMISLGKFQDRGVWQRKVGAVYAENRALKAIGNNKTFVDSYLFKQDQDTHSLQSHAPSSEPWPFKIFRSRLNPFFYITQATLSS